MKKLAILCCLLPVLAFAEEIPPTSREAVKENTAVDVSKISEAFGHLIGKNLESMGVKLELAKVIKGLQDANEGRDAPMTEMECVEAITAVQEATYKELSEGNLKKAEEFLSKNSLATGVRVLEPGKLQCIIEKEGSGGIVDEHCSPIIRYTGKFLDGTVFGASKEDEMVNLDETIPGFSKGLIGMKEGEKRMLYIHPDLGYGKEGYTPNSLLVFEVEVIKANAPQTETIDSLSPSTELKENPEIAFPLQETKAVR
jgi:peptidylprolyl isomerase